MQTLLLMVTLPASVVKRLRAVNTKLPAMVDPPPTYRSPPLAPLGDVIGARTSEPDANLPSAGLDTVIVPPGAIVVVDAKYVVPDDNRNRPPKLAKTAWLEIV